MRRLVVTGLYPNIGLPNPYTSHVADSPHDAAEALQHAALKAIDAMRGVLDAAEDLVADPGHTLFPYTTLFRDRKSVV